MDNLFKLGIFLKALVNRTVAVFSPQVLIDLGILNCLRLLRGRRESKKQYKRLNVLLSESSSWPPLNQTLSPRDYTVIQFS